MYSPQKHRNQVCKTIINRELPMLRGFFGVIAIIKFLIFVKMLHNSSLNADIFGEHD